MHTLLRETLNRGLRKVHVEKEVEYEAVDGMKTIIPYNSDWSALLVQVSGGLDSALMLYLAAKTFKNLNSKIPILPLSLEIPTKAKNLSSARSVINKVRDLVGYEELLPGKEVFMPREKAVIPEKNKFFNDTILALYDEQKFSFEFNGNTRNPPESARASFPNDNLRELKRDNRKSVYNAVISASPHALNDKKGIVDLYMREKILDELAPLTVSCDIELDEARNRRLNIPCDQCWWCHERKWGFTANGFSEADYEAKYKGHYSAE